MIRREDFVNAIGRPDAGFDAAVDAALLRAREKEEMEMLQRRRKLMVKTAIIALAALLALAGTALGLSRHEILNRIFTESRPDENAEAAVMSAAASDSCPYGTLTVTDYVLDGTDLYVEWTFETDSEENLLVQGDLLVNGSDEYLTNNMLVASDDSGTSYITEDTSYDLRENAGQTRRMKDGKFTALSHGMFVGDVPSEPFEVSRTLYIVRPLEDVLTLSMPTAGYYDETDEYGAPLEFAFLDGLYLTASLEWFSEEQMVPGGMAWIGTMSCWGGETVTLEDGTTVTGSSEEIQGEVLAKLEARFTVDPKNLPIHGTRLAEPQTFDCGIFDLTVTECQFTGINARMAYELRPHEGEDLASLDARWAGLRVRLPDGSLPEFGFSWDKTREGSIRGILWSVGGLAATPDSIALVPVEYVPEEENILGYAVHEELAVTVTLSANE